MKLLLKTPTVDRSYEFALGLAVLLTLGLAPAQAGAQSAASTVDDAVRAALENPGLDAAIAHRVRSEHAAMESELVREASLTELMDAYESSVELHLARLELQWEARRASIELDRRLGRGVAR